jgi:hypothetical protein
VPVAVMMIVILMMIIRWGGKGWGMKDSWKVFDLRLF